MALAAAHCAERRFVWSVWVWNPSPFYRNHGLVGSLPIFLRPYHWGCWKFWGLGLIYFEAQAFTHPQYSDKPEARIVTGLVDPGRLSQNGYTKQNECFMWDSPNVINNCSTMWGWQTFPAIQIVILGMVYIPTVHQPLGSAVLVISGWITDYSYSYSYRL